MKLGSAITNLTLELEANQKATLEKNNKVKALYKELYQSSDLTSAQKHKAKGKFLVRERIEALLDKGSYFLEVGALAGHEMYDSVPAGAGIVTGVGKVHGRECMVVANDATIKGGCYFPLTVKKHLRAQEIAFENRLPCIYLVDSGGAFLPMQDEVFPDKEHFGRIFYNQAKMSSLGIPQISAVLGSCTAGGAYVPSMCDESIIVKGNGTIFLGGPPLVKAATGQEVSAEELGGADLHAKESGVVDHIVEDEQGALLRLRQIVKNLGARTLSNLNRIEPQLPLYPKEDLAALIPVDRRKNFPIRQILARIIDNSEIDEFKSEYGKSIICGYARIDGYLVGIIANDGILFSESALKAAHFIQLCDRRKIPLIFFQNISGFMVGVDYEKGGIAKNGAKMVNAVACANVPKFTIVVGGSFGAGNYAMCGRAYNPRFMFTWPNAKTAVMGPEQAGSVLTQIKRDAQTKANETPNEKELSTYESRIISEYNLKSDALYATARLWDDGIIDPVDTRYVLARCLEVSANSSWKPSQFGIFRM